MKQFFTIILFLSFAYIANCQTVFDSFDTPIDSNFTVKSLGQSDSSYVNWYLEDQIVSDGTGALGLKYNVESVTDFGGSTILRLRHPNDGVWNFSAYESLSIDIYNKVASSWPERADMRIMLFDASSASNVSTTGWKNTEWWYSFSRVLDLEEGWHTITIPLKDVGSTARSDDGSGFWLTEWDGIKGNGTLDLDKIWGFGITISVQGPLDSAKIRGEFVLDNLSFNSAITFVKPRDIALEADGSLVASDDGQGVIRVNPTTGGLTLLSTNYIDGNPYVINYRGIAVDASGNLLLLDSGPNSLIKIDPTTGYKTVISDSTRGSGPFLLFPHCLEVEPNGQILVTDTDLDAIFRIDPNSGKRTIISDNSTGTGPNFEFPLGIAIEDDGNIVIIDAHVQAVFRVDPVTGNRTILSDANTGSGPALDFPYSVVTDADGSLIVVDEKLQAVVRIDAETGNRTIVSDANTGSGIDFDLPRAVEVLDDGGIVVFDRGVNKLILVDPLTGNRSIFPFPYDTTTGTGLESHGVNQNTAWSANYPNPFKIETNIQFNISRKEKVKLNVFDFSGREVAVLVDATLQEGSYNVTFNAKDLPSGVYFYRLQAGDLLETGKMVLSR